MAADGGRGRVLAVGATGWLGREMVWASLRAGHPTFALVRSIPDHDGDHGERDALLLSFADAGVTFLRGSLEDFPSLLEAVKNVDIVICTVPSKSALEQKLLIRAIKEAGSVKRFIPSEFGADPTKVQISNMDYNFYSRKAEIRRCIELKGIPHTYVSCNFLMRYMLPSLVQPGKKAPPRDQVTIFGTGDTKAVFVKDSDVAAFTIATMEDPRTLNKTLYLRPPGNVLSMNELITLWESKIRKNLIKVYVTEDQVLKNIEETPLPGKMDLIFVYSAFIKGDHTYFNVAECGVDGIQLYPHVHYTTVDEYLDTLL